jgi:hypothetical protein
MKIKHIKSCIIIYGCIDNLDFLETQGDCVNIIIEPRKRYIDNFYKSKFYKSNLQNSNIIFIKKLIGNDKVKECMLYCNNKTNIYDIDTNEYLGEKIDKNVLSKEVVYQTTFREIINTYNIQNIRCLIINIDILNLNKVFSDLIVFNHIISKIKLKKLEYSNNKFFENFEMQKCDIINSKSENEYFMFCHKNLNIALPSIAMYFSNFDNYSNNIEKIKLLIHQYQLKLIVSENDTSNNSDIYKIKSYSDCVNNLEMCKRDKLNRNNKTPYFEKIVNNLENIFEKSNIETDSVDIIIQFTPKFLNTNIFQIMYPLRDNVLYVNKAFDIIYSTKNCMYMLYQILKSKYFTDYIEQKRTSIKDNLFNFFSKNYFYEYISKIFVIKEFN